MKTWKHKILPTLLAGTLTFSFGAAVHADGFNGKGKSVKNKIKVEKIIKLKDIENHWAKRTVELMNALQIIKGYEDQTFRPQNVVTQAEAVVMVIRLLGLENEEIIEANSTLSIGPVPFWAKGSIEYALKNNLITAKEALQPNKAASRLFVTKLLVNALGVKEENWQKASLFFKDVDDLSREDRAYLASAILVALIKGYEDKTFKPNKPVTRAEMAVLIERLKNLKENQGDYTLPNSVSGVVSSINGDSMTITTSGSDRTYDIDDDVRVYVDGKQATLSSVKAGMRVRVALQADGDIGFIDAYTTDQADLPDTESISAVKEFKAELEDDDQKLEFKLVKTSNGFNAKVEVKSSTTVRETSGQAALIEIQALLEAAGISATSEVFSLSKFIDKVAEVYDLDSKVKVDIKLIVGDSRYTFEERVNVGEPTQPPSTDTYSASAGIGSMKATEKREITITAKSGYEIGSIVPRLIKFEESDGDNIDDLYVTAYTLSSDGKTATLVLNRDLTADGKADSPNDSDTTPEEVRLFTNGGIVSKSGAKLVIADNDGYLIANGMAQTPAITYTTQEVTPGEAAVAMVEATKMGNEVQDSTPDLTDKNLIVTVNEGVPTAVDVSAIDGTQATPREVVNALNTAIDTALGKDQVDVRFNSNRFVFVTKGTAATGTLPSLQFSGTAIADLGLDTEIAYGVEGKEAVAEVNKLIVTSGASAEGTIHVRVNDGTVNEQVSVSLTARDDAASKVAQKIRSALNSNRNVRAAYTISGNNEEVVLTAKHAGADKNVRLSIVQ